MNTKTTLGLCLIAAALLGAQLATLQADPNRTREDPEETVKAVKAVLTTYHEAAAEADAERYFGCLDPEGVFFGTAMEERWTTEDVRKLAAPSFERGIGWTSTAVEQNVYVSDDGKFAWFDERLKKPRLGAARGTGAMRKVDGEWKIVQYSMCFPIPNEIVTDVVKLIRAQERK